MGPEDLSTRASGRGSPSVWRETAHHNGAGHGRAGETRRESDRIDITVISLDDLLDLKRRASTITTSELISPRQTSWYSPVVRSIR